MNKEDISNLLHNAIKPDTITHLLYKGSVTNEDTSTIAKFINEYTTIDKYRKNELDFTDEALTQEIDKYLFSYVDLMNVCYSYNDDKNTPVVILAIKNGLNKTLMEDQSNSATKSNAYTKALTKPGYHNTYTYPEDIENDYGRVSGFVNNVFITMIIIALGIVVAIITFAIK